MLKPDERKSFLIEGIIERISYCMDQRDMSNRYMAEKLDMSIRTWRNWMKGKRSFTLDEISRIESVLGMMILKVREPLLWQTQLQGK